MTFNFHGIYSSEDKMKFELAQKEDLKRICNYLNTPANHLGKIKFEVFDSRERKQKADPYHSISRASARFNEMAIYRFWNKSDNPHFPHEITHLVAHTWAKPYLLKAELDTWDNKKITKTVEMVSTSFVQEGLAIAVDDIVFKRKLLEDGETKFIDDWCKKQLNRIPETLVKVINIDGFGSLPNKIVVPFAASFSKYLLVSFGIDKYKVMYVSLKETDTPLANVKKIEKAYGQTEKVLLDNWRVSLE